MMEIGSVDIAQAIILTTHLLKPLHWNQSRADRNS